MQTQFGAGFRAIVALLLAAVATSIAGDSAAQSNSAAAPASHSTARTPDPFAVSLGIDLPVALTAGLLGGGLQLLREELIDDRCAPHCDGTRVNALDGITRGHYSAAAANTGNALVVANVSLPLLVGAFDVGYGGARWREYGEDVLIVGQSLAVTVALQQLVAFAAQRPRPYTYNAGLDPALLRSANSYLSFYSGHTANAFAAASSYGYLFSVRHPNSRYRGAVWALGYGLAGLQGYLRVAAGYHYLTDVLVGAAAGTSVGLLLPWLHQLTPANAGRPPQAGFTLLPWADSGALGVQLSAWN